jgi:threonine dehydratase
LRSQNTQIQESLVQKWFLCLIKFDAMLLSPLSAAPNKNDIILTHVYIAPYIRRTPVLTSGSLNRLAGAELYFKCENFQKIGAFKMRGGASAAVRLTDEERRLGLATHSSGNHAQAIARAAKLLGAPAYIVMPDNAPRPKIEATLSYGAEIIFCAPTPEDREATLAEVVRKTGATFIHPYNDWNVIAGQATAAKELIEDAPVQLDIIIPPVGGGGLLSGTALAARYFSPSSRTIGAEPQAVDDARRSLQSGNIEKNLSTNTIADGLRTPLGEKTFAIIRQEVEDILTVDEEAIIEAMRLIYERLKIVIEPSCALPLAVVLANPPRFHNKKIGLILTGGNIDLNKLPF